MSAPGVSSRRIRLPPSAFLRFFAAREPIADIVDYFRQLVHAVDHVVGPFLQDVKRDTA